MLIGDLVGLLKGTDDYSPKLPLAGFANLSFSRLLGLCRGLSSVHVTAFKNQKLSVSQRAARMLQRWPENLYRGMDLLPERGRTGKRQLLPRMSAVRARVREAFSDVTDAGDVAHLLALFAAYVPGNSEEGSRLLAIDGPLRETTRRESKKAGSARSLRSGVVSAKGEMRTRYASLRLGISVGMLQYFRKHGHFEVLHNKGRVTAFALGDVEAFERKVSGLPIVRCQADGQSSLKVLLKKKLPGDSKNLFAAAVLEGKVDVVGRSGPLLGDLMVAASQAEELHQSLRRESFGGTLTCAEAGQLIGFNATKVTSLCRMGLVRSYRCLAGFRIYPGAIEEFAKEYAGVAEAAKLGKSGPKWAAIAAEELGFQLFRDGAHPTMSVFMHRANMPAVVARLLTTPRGVAKPAATGARAVRKIAAPVDAQSLIATGQFTVRPGARGARPGRKKRVLSGGATE